MKVIQQIKKFLNITFALFTCLSFMMIIFYRTTVGMGGIMWAWMDIERMFGDILIFALITGAVVTATDLIPKVPSVIKHVIKLVLVYGAFWFWMLDGEGISGSQRLIVSTIYVLSFAVIAGFGEVLKFVEKKLTAGKDDYKSIYTENKDEDTSANTKDRNKNKK